MPGPELDAASIVRREFNKLVPDEIVEETPLAELGVDSLDFFDKILTLEDEYGIKIDIAELDEDMTLRDVLSSLVDSRGN
jgi:acyl carrier protein